MEIKIKENKLVFGDDLSGPIYMQKESFCSEPCERKEIGTMKSGQRDLTLPEDLTHGLYRVFCGKDDICKNPLYYGKKTKVEWTADPYTDFDNQQVWRHKLDFAGISVVVGKDFFLTNKEVELSAASKRKSEFDFLYGLPKEDIKIKLSDELKAFIDEP